MEKSVTYTIKFPIGSLVFVKTDIEQLPHIVTGYMITPNNAIQYRAAYKNVDALFYDFELTDKEDTVKRLSS